MPQRNWTRISIDWRALVVALDECSIWILGYALIIILLFVFDDGSPEGYQGRKLMVIVWICPPFVLYNVYAALRRNSVFSRKD
jgi:hypothetical protein